MKKYILVGAIALFVMALAVLPATATIEKVTVMGTVIDDLGRPVADANVTLIDENFRELGTTTSDANGNFKFVNVELAGSTILKAKVSFTQNGTTYANRLENMQWLDASQGLATFDRNDTRLNHYPGSDHGYVWGLILDAATNGRTLDGRVYLANNTTTLSTETASNGAYEIMATPGDYEIYAVHEAGDSWRVSNRTKVAIYPSYSIYESAPLTLIADVVTVSPPPLPTGTVIELVKPRPTEILLPSPAVSPAATPAPEVKVAPLAAALALGIVIIIAGWVLLSRRQ